MIIEYRGIQFFVPDNYRELGITHAVCCEHVTRGPMVHRWKREHKERFDMQASATVLYGSAVGALTYIELPA